MGTNGRRSGAGWIAVIAGCLVLLALLACETPRTERALHVTAYTPTGTVDDAFTPVRIRFDRPAVHESELHKLLPESPVEFDPELKVSAHWVDRQTLLVKPLEAMQPSTRYQVEVGGDLADRMAKSLEFEFVHAPLRIEALQGVDPSWLPPKAEFSLHTSQPVRAEDAADACLLEPIDTDDAPALVAPSPESVATSVALRPEEPLIAGKRYRLKCRGLTAARGDEPMQEPFTRELHVLPPLSVHAFEPAAGKRVAPDELQMMLTLSTPVEVDELAKHVHIQPAVRDFGARWVRRSETEYTLEANLEAAQHYAVRLDGKLQDSFGQKLGKAVRFGFDTGDARPNIQMETGIYAVEAKGRPYPVWTRNVPSIDVACAQVPEAAVVGLLTSSLTYDPWYSVGNAESTDVDWASHGLDVRKERIDVAPAKNEWQLSELDLPARCGDGKPGLFLAEVRSKPVEDVRKQSFGTYPYRVLANVTDFGVLLKVGPASGLVWVTRLSDGQPVQGARVSLYDPRGKRVHRGRTDASGILRTPGAGTLIDTEVDRDPYAESSEWDEWDYYRSQRLIAIVEHAGDMAVVDGNWANGVQIWNFGVESDRRSAARRVRGFIHSDRGIYRPGETVHLRGLVREVAMGSPPRVPRDKRIAVHVEDAAGGSLREATLTLSRFGSFSLDVPLDLSAHTGDYYVQARIAGQSFRQRFAVEEFRPVAFEIEGKPKAQHVDLGSALSAAVQARYLFGAPVADAKVEWSVQRRPRHVQFKGFPQYQFSDRAGQDQWDYEHWEGDEGYAELVTEGEGRTDAQGRFRFRATDPTQGLQGAFDYLLRTAIADATDQTVTRTQVVSAHPTSFYYGLHAQEWVQAVDMPFAVNVVAVSPEGKRIAQPASLQYVHKRWECTTQGEHRTYRDCKRKDELVFERKLSIPQNGTLVEQILPKSPGEYMIRVVGKDARGRQVAASTSVWVLGAGEAFWSGDESVRMGLVASKTRYQPGETARVVAQADTAGSSMLVTLERDGVIDARLVQPASSSEGIEIPLDVSHAPNVYVSVAMVQGRLAEGDAGRPRFRLGLLDMEVSAARQRLQVRIDTERPQYRPGERVRGTLTVSADGEPVKAEVALSAADEGVLQLIGFETPDPMQAFYAPWGLGVDNGTNLNRIARLNDPSGALSEEGADHGGGAPELRSRFVSSALWMPALLTDAQGSASFEFDAPDNLTAFRIMGVAADDGARFGTGDARIEVRKEVLLQPALPRFFRSGDQVVVSAIVHNYTDSDGEASVELKAEGLQVKTPKQRVKVPAGKHASVRFAVKVGTAERAKLGLSTQLGDHRDGVSLELPIHRPLVRSSESLIDARVDEAEATLSFPDGADPALSHVEVVIDRSGLADLAPALRYLIQYPYGCLEQTLSRLVPMLEARGLAESLDIAELQGPKLDTYVRLGIAKVLRHQHADGHFSLWPSTQTQPQLTAYALWGLGEALRHGIPVPREALTRGTNALREWANRGTREASDASDAANMAMAAFVLADLDRPAPGLNARLFEAREAMPVFGRAWLLRALVLSKASTKQIETLAAEILKFADGKDDSLWIHEPGPKLWQLFSSDVRSTAIVLSALLALPEPPEVVPALVAGLKAKRKQGRWNNTQDNAHALIALADYARHQASGRSQVRVQLDDEVWEERSLEGNQVMRLTRPLSALKASELKVEASSPVHLAVRRYDVREAAPSTAAVRGIDVRRQILDFDTEQPVTTLKVGQLVRVRLDLRAPKARRYVALSAPLPAGLEALNPRLATEGTPPGDRIGLPWGFQHVELRDDRADFFADRLHPGEHRVEYLARATTAGTFHVPPAHAEEMYTPEVTGRTPTASLVIER